MRKQKSKRERKFKQTNKQANEREVRIQETYHYTKNKQKEENFHFSQNSNLKRVTFSNKRIETSLKVQKLSQTISQTHIQDFHFHNLKQSPSFEKFEEFFDFQQTAIYLNLYPLFIGIYPPFGMTKRK